MVKNDFGVMLLFQEGPVPNLGDGVSRPKQTEKTQMYKIEVRLKGSSPMRVTLPAATPEDALKFASNRWPGSTSKLI